MILAQVAGVWRALAPEALRRAAGRWLAPLAFELAVGQGRRTTGIPGVGPPVIVGMLQGASGIALSAHLASRAMTILGIEHRLVDASDIARAPRPSDIEASAWLFYLNPPELMPLLLRWDVSTLKGLKYGYWAWELPAAPKPWLGAVSAMDGVLVPSRYTSDAFGGASGVDVVPHPVMVEGLMPTRSSRRQSADFHCVSLFDFRSSVARKNPFATLEAFQTAFGEDPGARLTFKTQNAAEAPELFQAISTRVPDNVQIIDDRWDRARVIELIGSADALVSLHRAEGFGLQIAEAMAMGVPVVATAWSGNLDFMDEASACLVPATMIPVNDPQRIYRGQSWAEPNVGVAAAHLKRLRADSTFARGIGEAGLERVRALNAESWYAALPEQLRAVLHR